MGEMEEEWKIKEQEKMLGNLKTQRKETRKNLSESRIPEHVAMVEVNNVS